MAEQYQVTLHSQMGPRAGVLTLHFEGNYVIGSLEVVGYVNTVQGIRSEDGTLHLFHTIRTAVSTFPCETVLECGSGRLYGMTTAEPCRIWWEGVPLPGGAPVQAGQEEQRA